MIQESLSHLTVSSLKENSIMVSLKVKEYVLGLMEMNMLGNLKMGCNMEKEYIFSQTGLSMMESGRTERSTVKGF